MISGEHWTISSPWAFVISNFFFFKYCVLFKKTNVYDSIALDNYIRRRSYDDVMFAEFDRNFNFVPDYIFLDVVVCLENHENCNLYWIDFVSDEIAHSLMK